MEKESDGATAARETRGMNMAEITRLQCKRKRKATLKLNEDDEEAEEEGGKQPPQKESKSSAKDDQEEPKQDVRLHFDPRDRILFLHHGSNRVFEGWVSDVDRQSTLVRISIPLRRKRISSSSPREQSLCVQLDNYRHFKDYDLISLFRPAFPQLHAPPGFYLNHSTTDLWLDIDDVIEIVKQGSVAHKKIDTFEPQTFVARVTCVNDITCRIVPVHAPAPDPPPPPPIATTTNPNPESLPAPSDASLLSETKSVATMSAPPTRKKTKSENHLQLTASSTSTSSTEQLIALESASGTAPEWVSRNTLRFRKFIQKSTLRKHSLPFDPLVPSTTKHI